MGGEEDRPVRGDRRKRVLSKKQQRGGREIEIPLSPLQPKETFLEKHLKLGKIQEKMAEGIKRLSLSRVRKKRHEAANDFLWSSS